MRTVSTMLTFLMPPLAVYAGLVAVMYAFQRSLMYLPGGAPLPSPAEAGMPEAEPVRLATGDGLSLTAWYAPPGEGGDVVVYLHGNAGNIADRVYKARPFLDAGYGLLLVEYRGYGGNPGRPCEAGLYADGRAAIGFLQERGVSAERIALYGESLGSGVATLLAEEAARDGHPLGAVVLEAPYSSMARAAQDLYPWLPAAWLIIDRYDSLSRIGRMGSPLLIVHGERDRTVSAGHGRRLFEAAKEPKRLLLYPEAGHNDLFSHGAADGVLEFLQEKKLSS